MVDFGPEFSGLSATEQAAVQFCVEELSKGYPEAAHTVSVSKTPVGITLTIVAPGRYEQIVSDMMEPITSIMLNTGVLLFLTQGRRDSTGSAGESSPPQTASPTPHADVPASEESPVADEPQVGSGAPAREEAPTPMAAKPAIASAPADAAADSPKVAGSAFTTAKAEDRNPLLAPPPADVSRAVGAAEGSKEAGPRADAASAASPTPPSAAGPERATSAPSRELHTAPSIPFPSADGKGAQGSMDQTPLPVTAPPMPTPGAAAPALAASEPDPVAELAVVLFDDGDHYNLRTAGDARSGGRHLIVRGQSAMVLDPGSTRMFGRLDKDLSDTSGGRAGLAHVILSHPDPDAAAGVNAWLASTPATVWVPELWVRRVLDYGIDDAYWPRLRSIPDEGIWLDLEGDPIALLPAHFLHSPGNFNVWDPTARILYTGPLGSSFERRRGAIDDFDRHAEKMLQFHTRYPGSGQALKAWARMVAKLDVQRIVPLHGPYFKGRPMIERFLDWCMTLSSGMDLLPDAFELPKV